VTSAPREEWQGGDRTVEAPVMGRQSYPPPHQPYQQPYSPTPQPAAPPAAAAWPKLFWVKLFVTVFAGVLLAGAVLLFTAYQVVDHRIGQVSDDVTSDLSNLGDNLGDLGGLGG
jgi:hypothetical protein